jgi:hypothetical protein
VETSELIENRVVIVDVGVTRGGKLRENHRLNLTGEIEEDVVELSYRISDGGLYADSGIALIVLK